MYILHYIVAMLTFKCFLKAEVTKSTDLALNKPGYSSNPSGGSFPPSLAVDGRADTCCKADSSGGPVWVVFDLSYPFFIETIYVNFRIIGNNDPSNRKQIQILMMNGFDRNTRPPSPLKDTVCHIFDEMTRSYKGSLTCKTDKRNRQAYSYIAVWTELRAEIMEVCTFEVYEGCPNGLFGPKCARKCHCLYGTACDPKEGKCPSGCQPGYVGDTCDEIDINLLKLGCRRSCTVTDGLIDCRTKCYNRNKDIFAYACSFCTCSNFNGQDVNEVCLDAKTEKYSVCPMGYYGNECASKCSCKCGSYCSLSAGKCPKVNCREALKAPGKKSLKSKWKWLTSLLLLLVVILAGVILGLIIHEKQL